MGKTFFKQWIFGPDKDPAILDKVRRWGQKAITINQDDPSDYSILAHYYLWTKQHDLGIDEIKKAIALDPNNPELLAAYGELLTHSNQPEQGIALYEKAMRLDPKFPVWYIFGLGHAYFLTQAYEKTIPILENAVDKDPDFWPSYLLLAAAYDAKDMKEKSRDALKKALKKNKNLPNENWDQLLPYKDPAVRKQMKAVFKKINLYN